MVCASCGASNAASRRFCLECGTALASACPSCGEPNEPNAGSAALAARRWGSGPAWPPAAPMRMPRPWRRLPSGGSSRVLFADLVGFTTFAEGRDAEEVRETLSRYFELAADVVARYGGTVEKFIGDAVMAVWGAPTAHEDDAERAVRAGLELVDAIRVLGPGIEARAGVLTGEAAVTMGATNQGMVAGDLVNTAARLQSAAAPGTVLVGEATRRAASRAIAFEPAGEQALKGKASPVPAFSALRVVAERGGRRSEALEAPFVGRARGAAAAQGPLPRAPRGSGGRAWSPSPGRPASARRGSRGSSSSTSTGSSSRSGGTTAGAPRTATGSASGRSAR